MKIAVIGRGNVGGGLAGLWRAAGHEVAEIGHEGGDASGSDAVLLACPARAIGDALGSVEGIGNTPVIDATNVVTAGRPEGFGSLAAYVQSITGGPVAKSFNSNFARLYPRLGEARVPPSNVYAADDEAREVTEQLIRDAGYEPINLGGLENARLLEDQISFTMALAQAGLGQHYYRYWTP
jgi:8-hydroxy-5-deazaflavin:NADPH oxidoreductase